MTRAVTVDIAGAWMGGAARYAAELEGYLARTGRQDVRVIGKAQRVAPAWLVRREISRSRPRPAGWPSTTSASSFPGGRGGRYCGTPCTSSTDAEAERLDPALRASVQREAAVVRLAARRADVLVVPCTAMAERVSRALPGGPEPDRGARRTRSRLSSRSRPATREAAILCPVLFAPYKRMDERIAELLAAVDDGGDNTIRVRVTASPQELPAHLASHPRIEFLGRVGCAELRAGLGAQPRHLLPHRPGVLRLPARGGPGQRPSRDRPRYGAE